MPLRLDRSLGAGSTTGDSDIRFGPDPEVKVSRRASNTAA